MDIIHRKLVAAGAPGPAGCLSQRAFYRVRRALQTAFAVSRGQVRPDTPLSALLPAGKRRERWQLLQAHLGVNAFPRMFFGWQSFPRRTVGQLANSLAAGQPSSFRGPVRPWTRAQVRSLVRLLIVEQLGIKNFRDDDEFVRDLRVG